MIVKIDKSQENRKSIQVIELNLLLFEMNSFKHVEDIKKRY